MAMSKIGTGLTPAAEQQYQDHMRQMQNQQVGGIDPKIVSAVEVLENRLIEVEEFIKYAADVDPNFEKLLVGYRARKRIGI